MRVVKAAICPFLGFNHFSWHFQWYRTPSTNGQVGCHVLLKYLSQRYYWEAKDVAPPFSIWLLSVSTYIVNGKTGWLLKLVYYRTLKLRNSRSFAYIAVDDNVVLQFSFDVVNKDPSMSSKTEVYYLFQ